MLRKSDSDAEVEWVLAESGCNSLVHPLGYIAQCNIIAMHEGTTLSCLHESFTAYEGKTLSCLRKSSTAHEALSAIEYENIFNGAFLYYEKLLSLP